MRLIVLDLIVFLSVTVAAIIIVSIDINSWYVWPIIWLNGVTFAMTLVNLRHYASSKIVDASKSVST